MKMKCIAAIALLAATLPALAQTQLDPRTQDYRIWSAEQMISRFVTKWGNANHPTLNSIREAAATGDDVLWAKVVDGFHKMESDLDATRK